MKYLARNKIYQRVDPSKNAKKLYVFCEGERREIHYFKFFQGFSSNIDIIPIPSDEGKSDPEKLKQQAILLFKGNTSVRPQYRISREYEDEIWFVIDTDLWNIGGKIDILKDYCSENNKDYKCWFVAQSNPCFEIWLFYHFFEAIPDHVEVCSFSSFKEFVNRKIPGGFDNRSMPIEIESAINNAENNFRRKNGQPELYSTEVFLLAKMIVKFTQGPLSRCIEAMKGQA